MWEISKNPTITGKVILQNLSIEKLKLRDQHYKEHLRRKDFKDVDQRKLFFLLKDT